MIDTLVRLFKYDDWANHETMQSVRAMANPPAKAIKLMAHIASAQRLWLERMKAIPQSLPVWPEWTLEETEAELSKLKRDWRLFLGEKKDADLALRFQYTNTKGEHFSSPIGDTAMHLITHGVHHRGQIALLVREAGGEPAYTDFIHAARSGKI